MQQYLRATATGTYSFLAALPLVLLYEVLILLANQRNGGPVRVGADVWIKQLLSLFNGPLHLTFGCAIVLVGIWIILAERKKDITLRGDYFFGMVAESAGYAICLGVVITYLVGAVFSAQIRPAAAAGGFADLDLTTQLALSLGAGIYEELIFRVILVGGLFRMLRRSMRRRSRAYVAAAVIGAALFSLVHYLGTMGDQFQLASFVFRFIFGLALNGIYLWRGFGVAAWTHALYDVSVVISMALG